MPAPVNPGAPRGFCFMVMPFGERAIGLDKADAPKKIDFNALWEKAFKPALEQLGYIAVRGDDGSLTENIVRDILESLTLSDLVVADITATNANVFYEVGVRHAVPGGLPCVMLAANWAQPPFDVHGTRQLRYPFPATEPTDADYERIRAVIVTELHTLAEFGTPMCVVSNYPTTTLADAPSFHRRLSELNAFQSAVRSVRLASKDSRPEAARKLLDRYAHGINSAQYLTRSVALELVMIARDTLNWDDMLALVEELPQKVRELPQFVEQEQLALAKKGDVTGSIARLEALVERHGASPERHGLLGGRWKQLYFASNSAQDREDCLERLLAHYSLGMELDLNAYYCASNLPRYLRQRGQAADLERARIVLPFVELCTSRAASRHADDRWARLTLLCAALDAGDVPKARERLDVVRRTRPPEWELESLLVDMQLSVSQQTNEIRAELSSVVDDVRKWLESN